MTVVADPQQEERIRPRSASPGRPIGRCSGPGRGRRSRSRAAPPPLPGTIAGRPWSRRDGRFRPRPLVTGPGPTKTPTPAMSLPSLQASPFVRSVPRVGQEHVVTVGRQLRAVFDPVGGAMKLSMRIDCAIPAHVPGSARRRTWRRWWHRPRSSIGGQAPAGVAVDATLHQGASAGTRVGVGSSGRRRRRGRLQRRAPRRARGRRWRVRPHGDRGSGAARCRIDAPGWGARRRAAAEDRDTRPLA